MNIFERAGFIKVEDGVWTDPSLQGQRTIYVRECVCGSQPPHYVACGEYESVSSIGKKLFPFIAAEKYQTLDNDLRQRLFVPVQTTVGEHPFTVRRVYRCDIRRENIHIAMEYEPRNEHIWLVNYGRIINSVDEHIKHNKNYPGSAFALTTRIHNMNVELQIANAKIEQLTAALNSAIDQINDLREALAYAPGGYDYQRAKEHFEKSAH